MLASQTDPFLRFYVASPLNPIFMLGGAPEAHEVLSKTPRFEIPLRANVRPEAFPIKASGKPEVMDMEWNLALSRPNALNCCKPGVI